MTNWVGKASKVALGTFHPAGVADPVPLIYYKPSTPSESSTKSHISANLSNDPKGCQMSIEMQSLSFHRL